MSRSWWARSESRDSSVSALEGRFPTALVRQCLGRRGLNILHRLQHERRLACPGMQEADGNAAIAFGQDLRRDGQSHHFVAGRQDHLVAFDAQGAIKHQAVAAVGVVAFLVLVGLENDDAALAVLRHGPRQSHLDVARVRVRIRHQRVLASLRPTHHFETQRLATHGIEHFLLARRAAFANRVVEIFRTCGGRGDFVIDPEARSLRCQQLIPGVFVRLPLGDGREGEDQTECE